MKAVIIGGVAGGASAAARLRRLDENAEITIFERSGYVSYANCGLPYYIGGEIENEKSLTLQTPESFLKRFNIRVFVRHEALKINREKKTVTVKNLETGEIFEKEYDKLLLSPGAKPLIPDMPGTDSKRLFTLRTVEDTLKIKSFVQTHAPKTAVIAGGGFIGLEVAENLMQLGVRVSILQRGDRLLSPLDADMSSFLTAKMQSEGAKIHLNTGVRGFSEENETISALLDGGQRITADFAVLAIGVQPESTLARDAHLALGIRGSILVNEFMQTSDESIYAVGDAVQVKNLVTGRDALISLAGPANRQGRTAADNMAGRKKPFPGAYASSVIKLLDMTAAATGINEEAARSEGLSYEKIVLSPPGHASYYPGSRAMTIKLLYEKGSLRILGAQIVGFDGVDKRIDVFATAMQAQLPVTALADLFLAYAPPYSSVKDPVNMAGFMAENIENGLVKQFHWHDVAALSRDEGAFLLDARTSAEYASGHADGFVNIPVDELRGRLSEIPREKRVYVMCQSGLRSYLASRILLENGFDAFNFSGGYRFYKSVTESLFREGASTPCGL